MFQNAKAFGSFSVNDLQKAKEFYTQILGLQASENNGMLQLSTDGNNPIIVYPKPNHEPATFTILNFPVDNVEKVVDDLIGKGIKFEQYTGMIQTDEKGICRNSAGP